MIEQKQNCEVELTFRFFSYQSGGKILWNYEVNYHGRIRMGKNAGGWETMEEAVQAASILWGPPKQLTY